jgi:hypothetical protein
MWLDEAEGGRRRVESNGFWTQLIFAGVLMGMVLWAVMPLVMGDSRRGVGPEVLYHDRFLEIYSDYLVIHHFYPGPIGKKMIPFASIRAIKLADLEFWDGRVRIEGTGDLKTWFARDIHRFMRNMAFILYLDHGRYQVGFSAENFRKAASIFQSRGLLVQEVYRKNIRKS